MLFVFCLLLEAPFVYIVSFILYVFCTFTLFTCTRTGILFVRVSKVKNEVNFSSRVEKKKEGVLQYCL